MVKAMEELEVGDELVGMYSGDRMVVCGKMLKHGEIKFQVRYLKNEEPEDEWFSPDSLYTCCEVVEPDVVEHGSIKHDFYVGQKLVDKSSGGPVFLVNMAKAKSGEILFRVKHFEHSSERGVWYDEDYFLKYFEPFVEPPPTPSADDFAFSCTSCATPSYTPSSMIEVHPKLPADLPPGVQMELCLKKWRAVEHAVMFSPSHPMRFSSSESRIEDGGFTTCAFCAKYYHGYESCDVSCPICQYTGRDHCDGTPYIWWRLSRSLPAAHAMVAFLEDLRKWGREKGLWE